MTGAGREIGDGEFKFLNTRPRVKESATEWPFSDDLSLRLADGESSMTLSLSSSTLLGDAPIGDNLLFVNLVV
jgi:hypothetical protein